MARSAIELWNSVKGLIIDQYKDSSNLNSLLDGIIGSFQDLEDSNAAISGAFDVSAATGEWLDIIGALKNVSRNDGETDADYLTRMLSEFSIHDECTCDRVISRSAELSGDPAPIYFEESPATFFIYTPNGNQIARNKIRKLAPTGVLGLPGAAIVTATGKKVTGCNGKKILGVAIDANIGNDGAYTLLTENEDNVATETGEILTTEKGV